MRALKNVWNSEIALFLTMDGGWMDGGIMGGMGEKWVGGGGNLDHPPSVRMQARMWRKDDSYFRRQKM